MLGKKFGNLGVAELAGLIAGVAPLDASTARRKLKLLDQELARTE
jgi:hypothetical protein